MNIHGLAPTGVVVRVLRSLVDPAARLASGPVLLAGSLALAMGCATPAQRAERRATVLGFERVQVVGSHFEHVLYWKPAPASGALHVYIEGDGSPARAIRHRPPDPTPSDALMLTLMAQDPALSLYLGRPAQHGAAAAPWYWTLGRYSEEVVDSMAHALESWNASHGRQPLVLIGHSGGGTLAMLLAERVPRTLGVVTLAGNLDLESWRLHHGFSQLEDSLDPATRPPLARDLFQIHLIGGKDRRVPGELTAASIARQPAADKRFYPGFDHRCCWDSIWRQVLHELRDRQRSTPRLNSGA